MIFETIMGLIVGWIVLEILVRGLSLEKDPPSFMRRDPT